MRDHAHKALQAVVGAVHDGMESHLRSIIGSWVSGMCDTYAPAAASARSAFEAAFSAKKQEELYSVMLKSIVKVRGLGICANNVPRRFNQFTLAFLSVYLALVMKRIIWLF